MKHSKKLFGIVAILLALIMLSSCVTDGKAPKATHEFSISILKIGKADAIILKTENHTAVIDCGEEDDAAEIIKHLAAAGVERIDCLFITHFDKDHVGGASELVNSLEAKEIIMPDYVGTSDAYSVFVSTLQEKNIKPTLLTEERSFVLDDVLFDVYPPQKDYYEKGDNDYSLVIAVTHGKNRFLFAGDAEKERLAELPEQIDLDCDFLKMPHHGNFNKGISDFIKSVSPVYTVICDSIKNPAADKTIKALEEAGSKIYQTQYGDVSVTSNGKSIEIRQ